MKALITNGGTHPPEKWAVVTAEHICPIDEAVDGDRLLAAKRLQLAIADALVPHHTKVQEAEKAGLKAKGDDHFDAPAGPEGFLDETVAAIAAAAVGTPWEAHFADPAVQAVIRQEVGNHFATVQDIERQWHADKHPHHPKAQAFKCERHPPAVVAEA